MASRLALAAVVVVVPLLLNPPAAADVFPPPTVKSSGRNEHHPEWRRLRLQVDGGFGFPINPADFQGYWDPAAAFGLGLSRGHSPWLDLVMRGEAYTMAFDEAQFRASVGPPEPGDHDTDVALLLLLLRVHPGREGYRPYVDAGVGLMQVLQPAVSYVDGNGTRQTFPGADIFGFDPCYSFGFGVEWTQYYPIFGGYVEARVVNTPGISEAPHTIATLRAGIQMTVARR